ncbi:MAG: PKD domain-containing protein, partial [Cyclobacteriaceae bacterium]
SASSDPDGSIAAYAWSWAGGGTASGVNPTVILPTGATTVTLTVTDNADATDTDQVIITVNQPANLPPTANAGPDQTVVDEDRNGQASVTLDGSASSDPDGSIDAYAWSWSGGGSATGVNPSVILPTGATTVTLTVTDNAGATASDQVIITVNQPANLPPTANAGPNQTVTDTNGNGTEDVTLDGSASADADGSIDAYAWSWEDGGSASGVSPTVNLPIGATTITLTITDNAGATASDQVIITVNAPAAPTFSLSNAEVLENEEVGTKVGDFSTASAITLSYTLPNGQLDNQFFSIENGNELVTDAVFDREAKASYTIRVRANYLAGFAIQEFTITVTNVAEPPTDITLTPSSVNENEPKNTEVGTFSVTGGESASVSYQFVNGANDNGSFRLDGNRLLTNAVFDREVKSSYTIRVRAIGEAPFAKDFTINITNVNDAPTISVTNDRILFAEGDDPVRILTDITVADVDNPVLSSATLTFVNNFVSDEDELVSDKGTWNSTTGELVITGPISIADLQKELRNVRYKNNKTINPTSSAREIRVVVNDGALDSNNERIFVLVDNPNVPPAITDVELQTPENQPLTLTSANFEGNYEDADDDFPNQIYIESTPSNGVLTVDGQVITNTSIVENRPRGFLVDFSAIENFVYTPIDNFNGTDEFRWNVYDDDNGANGAQVSITVSPVNDAPSITAPIQLSTQESEPLPLDGISYEDPDNDVLSVILSVTDGFLLVDPSLSESVSVLDGDDNGAKRLQVEGTATDLAAIMEGIAYMANETPAERDELSIVLTDSPSNASGAFTDEATVAIVITPNNDAPVLSSIEEGPLAYEENSEPVLLTETLVVTDEENNNILAAVLTIVDGEEGDELIFNDTEAIQASLNNNELLLQGEASLEAYQAAIRTILFVSSNDNPSATPRVIQIQVTDVNNGISNVVNRAIEITPIDDITMIEQVDEEVFYIIGSEQINPFPNGVISDPDNATLASLTVQFEEDSFTPGTDVLALAQTTGVSINWNETNGILSINGEAELATYQNLLQAIAFQHGGTEVADKTLSITTTTPNEASNSVTQLIRIVFNQPPQLTNIELNINSGEVYSFTPETFLEAYTDPDNFPIEGGFEAVLITSLPETGQLRLSQEPITQAQLGSEGLLIEREDIPLLSYVMPSNETTSDMFSWNATDGAEFAEQNATVTFTINLLSVSLGNEVEEICNGESVTLMAVTESGEAPFSYEWTCDLGNCAISGTEASASVSPTESSTYQVTVTDANGIQTSSSVQVNVTDCALVIPSGFTPNGDNVNDTWQLQNISTFENKIVEVYDRYGHQVFYSNNYSAPWTGEYEGKKLPTGTYYYRIELDGGTQSYQGKVTILQ